MSFLGVLLLLVSLPPFSPLPPGTLPTSSLNTASGEVGPHAVDNWAWPVRRVDRRPGLLQTLGLTAFCLPLWLGGLEGWTWMHSHPSGSAWLRWTGTILALIFLPAIFGLLPWHWRWLHLLPC